MPELPEVETIAADLRPHLVGRTFLRCELRFPTIVRHPEPEVFVDSIVGMRVTAVGRRGKYILIRLVDDIVLVFDLDDRRQLRYRDPRRFGRLLLGTEANLLDVRAMPPLGPEPIDPGFGAD